MFLFDGFERLALWQQFINDVLAAQRQLGM